MKNILLISLLIFFILSVKAVASDQSYEVNEYKAPSGGWKIIHQWNAERKSYEYEKEKIKAVSPAGKEILIKKWGNSPHVTWLDSRTAEITETCGAPCEVMYFFDTKRGVSELFDNVIAYSMKDNLIVYPSSNDKKDLYEITISEIYTDKKQPIAVINRNWKSSVYMSYDLVSKAVLSRDKIYIEYIDCNKNYNCEEKKKVSFLKKNPLLLFAMAIPQKMKVSRLNIAR